MTVEERIRRIRTIDQIKNNITYSRKLGLKDTSFWKGENKREIYSHRLGNESLTTKVQEELFTEDLLNEQ